MNVLVVGCGRLGSRLARLLDENGHDVSVVDSCEDNFRHLGNEFNGITVTGFPMDMRVLKNAGVESCDAVAVVTPDDNLNITVSQICRHFFGLEKVVARISDPDREQVFQNLGLKTICPTKLAGNAMYTALEEAWTEKTVTFDTSTVSFRCVAVDKALIDCNVNMAPCRSGESILGVLSADGRMKLCGTEERIVLKAGDKLIYADIVD